MFRVVTLARKLCAFHLLALSKNFSCFATFRWRPSSFQKDELWTALTQTLFPQQTFFAQQTLFAQRTNLLVDLPEKERDKLPQISWKTTNEKSLLFKFAFLTINSSNFVPLTKWRKSVESSPLVNLIELNSMETPTALKAYELSWAI